MRAIVVALLLVVLLAAPDFTPSATGAVEGKQSSPSHVSQSPIDVAAYVNPFIGTAPAPNTGYGLEFDGGDVFPGAAYPTGMLDWSPDTVEHHIPGGYFYPDRTISGFSLTHFSGRGCTAYQDVPIMPIAGELGASPRQQPAVTQATFSHANESAAPGYYAVSLDDGIQVQLSVTPRTGIGAVTFPNSSGSTGTFVVDAGGSVNDVSNSQVSVDPQRQLVTGSLVTQVGCGTDRYTLYFAIAFDRPFAGSGTWSEQQLQPGSTAAHAVHAGAYVSFDLSQGLQVQLKPAISYVSVDNALANLQAENTSWDFDAVRDAARSAWNSALNRVMVSGGSDAERTVFYTALYHTFFHPNLFSDSNGQYIGFDDVVRQAPPGHAHYANIPGWDQYRSLIQLRSLLDPDQTSDIIQSLVDDAAQGGGGMPRWEQANRNSAGMVGDSPGVYVADAFAFGARQFDAAAALTALDYGASQANATSGSHIVREYLQPWLSLGYVPDQPSISLEYAADDFAIGQLAQALGASDMAQRYAQRAANWTRTFNSATGYVEPRDASGVFAGPADHAHACCGFVEGNAAQYTFMVPFDYPGLFAQLGGRQAALDRLDTFFSQVNAGENRPFAWVGNEPSLDAVWAYDFADAPDRAQAVVRRIQTTLFTPDPGGLPGNDDGGTTSAWYVFSALGLFPAVPGVGGFALGSPLFTSADVQLGDGSVLHIVGQGADDAAPYVRSVLLDGAAHDSAWIDWTRLSRGATLEFQLDASPSDWGH
jgi:predicted alpha-1,2-mannosidase